MLKFGKFRAVCWVVGFWCDDIKGYEEGYYYSKKNVKIVLKRGNAKLLRKEYYYA